MMSSGQAESAAPGGDRMIESFLFGIIVGVFALIVIAELTYRDDDED